eukprot:6063040-Lingulodinium_polyedra.AAC.1
MRSGCWGRRRKEVWRSCCSAACKSCGKSSSERVAVSRASQQLGSGGGIRWRRGAVAEPRASLLCEQTC